jgi:hypothetical protein
MHKVIRRLLPLSIVLTLTACGTINPQEYASTLDTRSPLYETAECQQARKMAKNFEDRDLARGGAGVAAGVVVGVIAAPIMGVIETDATRKKQSVVERLKKDCEGVVIVDATDPDRKTVLPTRQAASVKRAEEQAATADIRASRALPVQERLARLDDLRAKKLITDAEYNQQRRAILSGL